MQGELSAADNEQISWSHNGNAFYLSHYHTFCHDQRAGGCYNNYSATASTDLYGWTASPGYSYTRSVQRFWQLPEMASVTYRIFDLWISFCQEGGILGAHLLAGNGMLPWETAVWLPVTATIRSITTGP
ncbi:TPA: hypothetical protein N3Z68_004692 [Salmonella enterica subsp. enterica serovar 16:l,v:-]|nr:hypothetical protein [Salmonella enterica subsp. enterica serovar 16:l,v:-]